MADLSVENDRQKHYCDEAAASTGESLVSTFLVEVKSDWYTHLVKGRNGVPEFHAHFVLKVFFINFNNALKF